MVCPNLLPGKKIFLFNFADQADTFSDPVSHKKNISVSNFQNLSIFTKNLKAMSDHHNDHSHDHGHDDHGHHGSDYTYFDDTTNILTPVYIIIALIVIFGIFFFG